MNEKTKLRLCAGAYLGVGLIFASGIVMAIKNRSNSGLESKAKQEVVVGARQVENSEIIREDVYVGGENRDNLTRALERHEGRRNVVYLDTEGNRTIGVGFNLERADARERIVGLGLNYEAVLNGQELTDGQIDNLLQEDINTATGDARRYVGEGFDELPQEAQNIITNMAFNLGYTRLNEFNNLRTALQNRDYNSAADEMVNSRWYGQVGRRSRELVVEMRRLDESD